MGAARQPVIGRHGHLKRLARQRQHAQPLRAGRYLRQRVPDHHIVVGGSPAEVSLGNIVIGEREGDRATGQRAQHRRQQKLRRTRQCGHPDEAAWLALQGVHLVLQPGQRGGHVRRTERQQSAGGGEAQPASVRFDQGNAEGTLGRLQLLAHR